MRAEVVTVGTELLLGQVVDTNSAWLAEQLAAIGVHVHFQTTVGDNHGRIVEALKAAASRADAVLVTGGLGPTQDDITREAIAEVTGRPLRRDPAIASAIEAMFKSRGREMPASNLRQADVPEGATVIPQRMGTAPGLVVPAGSDGQVVYAVPGVPAEMKEMFERAIAPDLVARMGEAAVIRSRFLKCWGVAESKLAELLHDRFVALEGSPTTTLAFLAGEGVVRVRISVRAPSAEEAKHLLDAEHEACAAALGDAVFGVDSDTLESVVVGLLAERGLRLAAAESMTGGMFGAWLTRVPGASDVFAGSAVTYATEAKSALLGVPEAVIAEHGPVSAPVARMMAEGARTAFGADVGVSVTGSAGPGTQGDAPVGQVFLGISFGAGVAASRASSVGTPPGAPPGAPPGDASRESTARSPELDELAEGGEVVEVRLPGDREHIRIYAVASLLDLLRRRLQS